MDYEDKKRIFQQYIEALEEERQKMQVFHRELPLSLHLVSQAIDGYRQQMTSELFLFGRSECEETSSDGQPVLEEFIPLKRGSSSFEKEEEEEEEEEITNERSGKKPDWLRSVQLWNQEPDPLSNEESSRKPAAVDEMMVKNKTKVGGAFHPFHGEKNTSKAQAAATSSTAETRRREEKDGRKARRCWSPELHRRFLQALQQLGGPHVATPKQIKELMKVDGLTNDEVKSHLQKYRLHNRRPLSAAVQGCGGGSTTEPTPQLLVVGGIWVPPPEYAMGAKATDTTTKVYAPVPTLPQLSPSPPHKQKQTHQSPTSPLQWKGGKGTLEEDHANSSSRTTSSSSHTTTTSPPL